jgi:hypothetical protein
MTRRRFVTLAGLVLVAGAAGVSWLRRDTLRRWLIDAPPDASRVGPLSPRAETVVRAVAVAMFGEPIDTDHYLRVFAYRAEHVPGHRQMFESFASHLDQAARYAGAKGFESLPLEHQRRLLADLRPARGWRRAWRGVADRERARDSEQVVRAYMWVFAGTDAWLRSGYEAWPATPRLITVPEARTRG